MSLACESVVGQFHCMEPTVYIMANPSRTVLYTGVTSNLMHRIFEHQNKITPGFTSQYHVYSLIYYECFDRMLDAITREKMIKKKSRRGKVLLIEAMNPDWNDLSSRI